MGSFLYQKCKEILKCRIFEELNLIFTILLCLQEDACGCKMWFQIREEVLSSPGHLRPHVRIPGTVDGHSCYSAAADAVLLFHNYIKHK